MLTNVQVTVEEASLLALRDSNWKFIPAHRKRKPQLFNLDIDPGEQNNIANKLPKRVEAMQAKLNAIRNAKNGVRSLF